MRESKNPALRDSIFEQFHEAQSLPIAERMTVTGTAQKTALLLMIVVAGAIWGWQYENVMLLAGIWVVTLGLAVVMGFRPQLSPVLAPIHAGIKGFAVGILSQFINQSVADTKYAGAVPLAVLATFVAFGIMLALYAFRIFRLNETGRNMVIGMTLAAAVFYLFCGVAYWFAPQWVSSFSVFGSSPVGIAFSVFMIGLACFNFLVDFWAIESQAEQGVPKFMEWYCGWALMVTIVWLYIEILRLFLKLARR